MLPVLLLMPKGSEHLRKSAGKPSLSKSGGAESGALPAKMPPIDPGLAEVIKAWPALLESVRAGILAMIKATLPADKR